MAHASDTLGTLGILGGGQLGRMTALAARSLGYRVHALDPDAGSPIAPVVDHLTVAALDDVAAARRFAAETDVVTLDVEHVPAHLLCELEAVTHVRPRGRTLHVVQDRARQKSWLAQRGFPVGPFAVCESVEALADALRALGPDAYVKATGGGFDGRGQARAAPGADPDALLRAVGSSRVIVEQALPMSAELSVLVVRRPSGDARTYLPALNQHVDGVLSHTVLPAPLPAPVLCRACKLATDIAQELAIVGLCVVEMFLMPDGGLLVNELAARPHNSYHGSDRAFATGQFEQHVRAVFDLPLGPTEILQPTAMVNLLGDLWLSQRAPSFGRAWDVPGVRVHLYGKRDPRRGRKVGHLTATGATSDEALEFALRARDALVAEASATSRAPGPRESA